MIGLRSYVVQHFKSVFAAEFQAYKERRARGPNQQAKHSHINIERTRTRRRPWVLFYSHIAQAGAATHDIYSTGRNSNICFSATPERDATAYTPRRNSTQKEEKKKAPLPSVAPMPYVMTTDPSAAPATEATLGPEYTKSVSP